MESIRKISSLKRLIRARKHAEMLRDLKERMQALELDIMVFYI